MGYGSHYSNKRQAKLHFESNLDREDLTKELVTMRNYNQFYGDHHGALELASCFLYFQRQKFANHIEIGGDG